MPVQDILRAVVAGWFAQAPVTDANGQPMLPLYIALGNGTGTHSNTDLSLFAEVYNTRLAFSYQSVYQAYTTQTSLNYTPNNPTGSFTEAGAWDAPATTTALSAAVSAGATSVPVATATSPAVVGGRNPGSSPPPILTIVPIRNTSKLRTQPRKERVRGRSRRGCNMPTPAGRQWSSLRAICSRP